jgi:hypothetical protein
LKGRETKQGKILLEHCNVGRQPERSAMKTSIQKQGRMVIEEAGGGGEGEGGEKKGKGREGPEPDSEGRDDSDE